MFATTPPLSRLSIAFPAFFPKTSNVDVVNDAGVTILDVALAIQGPFHRALCRKYKLNPEDEEMCSEFFRDDEM